MDGGAEDRLGSAVAMSNQASWVGQPRIRGFSESMRMFLLTSSIIGLQFAWGTEVYPEFLESSHLLTVNPTDDLLHALSTLTRTVKEQAIVSMDCRTFVRARHAADHRDTE